MRRQSSPIYSRPYVLIGCAVLFFVVMFLVLLSPNGSGDSFRDEVMWDLNLADDINDLENTVEDLRAQYMKLVDIQANYESQISQVRRQIFTRKAFLNHKPDPEGILTGKKSKTRCEVLEEALNLCMADRNKFSVTYESLLGLAKQRGIDTSYVVDLRNGADKALQ